jgi:hypothetical protein
MKNNVGQIVVHFIGCLVFLTLPFLFTPDRQEFVDKFHDFRTLREFTSYILLIGFFYANFFWLVPRLYLQQHYVYYGISIVIFYVLISFIPEVIVPFEPSLYGVPPMPPPGGKFLFRINHNFFLFLVIGLFSLMLKITARWRLSEEEKLSAELAFLKAQINPHFLFNTLNSIYSLAIEKSDYTAAAVVKLSGMMRYVISEADQDFVPLEKEIAYVNSYIDLQKIRFGSSIKVQVEINGNPSGKKIAPLLLMPFIENAFKYGVNAEDDSDILIRIEIIGDEVNLQVRNNKVMLQHLDEDSSGIGIVNTRNRLQLLYPGKHTLSIQDTVAEFNVILVLKV